MINKLLLSNITVPPIILNTGHSEFDFAQRVFNEYNQFIIKILLKPFYEDWDEKIEGIINLIERNSNENIDYHSTHIKNKFKVKINGDVHFIPYQDIMYIEVEEQLKGSGKVLLVSYKKEYQLNLSLQSLESDLASHGFIRISRNTIINLHMIENYSNSEKIIKLELCKKEFQVGDAYLGGLKEYL